MNLNAGAKNLIDRLKKNNIGTIAVQERQERQNETPPRLFITDSFSQKNLLKPAVVIYIQLSIDTAARIVSSLDESDCLVCFDDDVLLKKTKEILKIKDGTQSVDFFKKRAEDWVMAPIFDNKNSGIIKFWKMF
jgi:hypothetical protein